MCGGGGDPFCRAWVSVGGIGVTRALLLGEAACVGRLRKGPVYVCGVGECVETIGCSGVQVIVSTSLL